MNDAILKELKIVVERVVRPLSKSAAAKRWMREELLAHLLAIYDEEAESLGDTPAALDRVKSRFGDAGKLSRELQQAVSFGDRLRSHFDGWWAFESHRSAFYLAGRSAMIVFTMHVLLLPGLLLLAVWNPRKLPPMMVPPFSLVVASITSVFLFMFLWFALSIGRALQGSEVKRSPLRAAVLCVASLALLPVLAFVPVWLLSGDLALSLEHLRRGCYFAPLAPVVLILWSRQLAEEMRYHEEWMTLEI